MMVPIRVSAAQCSRTLVLIKIFCVGCSFHVFAQNYGLPVFYPSERMMGIYQIKKTDVEKKSMKHMFTIVFKDSSSTYNEAKIDEHKGQFYLAIDNIAFARSVRPAETLFVQRIDKKGNRFIGIPTDSCWLFKLDNSRINPYSVLTERDLRFVVGIQKGDGPIFRLTKKNLEAMMENPSQQVIALINQGKLRDALALYNSSK